MIDNVLVETRQEIRESGSDGRVASLTAASAPPVEARRWAAGFTVADGLMLLIGLLAAVARFMNLGAQPLSPAEADAALTSWQFARGVPLTATPDSPAYFTFTSLIMSLGGDGDAAARLAPAVFGLLTVLLPWLWRGRFRPGVWLTAGALLAVSPIQMIISRTAGGEAIALFALLYVIVTNNELRDFFAFTPVSNISWAFATAATVLAIALRWALSRYWQRILDVVTARPGPEQTPRGRPA